MSWKDVIGLGVAGNFTGHLEQAGEAGRFDQSAIRRIAVADESPRSTGISLLRQEVV